MNDLRKAAEMALDVLETTWGNGSEGTLKQWEETIQALRQALAEEALDRMVAENQRLGLYDDAPPKKEWVGLTDYEFEEILEAHNEAFRFAFYESIEAKLKEKNT